MKKILKIIKNIITTIIAVIAAVMVVFTVFSVTTLDQTDRSIFGYHAFIVLSDSMSATDFSAGDLVLVKEVDTSTLEEGDIISFVSTDSESYGEVITHKIREVTQDSSGSLAFVTYGTTTDTDDSSLVSASMVIGKYVRAFKGVGTFLSYIKTVPGYIVCIFIPFALLIVLQTINSVLLFRKYKKEQMAEVESERKKQEEEFEAQKRELAAQQEESRRMMEELARLKEEMAEKNQPKPDSAE